MLLPCSFYSSNSSLFEKNIANQPPKIKENEKIAGSTVQQTENIYSFLFFLGPRDSSQQNASSRENGFR